MVRTARTMYVNDNNRLFIKVDGPSLWIKEKEKAGRRVPLRFIDQVIIAGNVVIETGVITLLAEHGVPVLFLNKKNGIKATVLESDTTYTILKEKMERLRLSIEGQKRVRQWLNARRRNLQRRLLIELNKGFRWRIKKKGLKEEDYTHYITTLLLKEIKDGSIKPVQNILDGLIHETVLKKVLEAELDPHISFLHACQNFAFIKDLSYALEAEKDRQTIQFFKSPCAEQFICRKDGVWDINSRGMKNIVVRFENHRERFLKDIDLLLIDFFELLREHWR